MDKLRSLDPDIVETISHYFETWPPKCVEHSVKEPAYTSQLYGVGFHVRFATPDGAEREDCEVDAPKYGERKSADERSDSVAPQFYVRE